jgi:hypothetical protein
MHRIRMSLGYFAAFGWDATVVMVDEKYSDLPKDELLIQSIPPDLKIYKVKALNKRWTSKIGLGSIALRSLLYYRKKVNGLLKAGKYDLIYFSTTQFPVCILGAYWKKRFNVPYVIDMQDPWHSEYYQDKPKSQQPSKYWISYPLNKYLEPIAIKNCDGLISVSKNYIVDLKERYPGIKNIPEASITFASFAKDLEIAKNNWKLFAPLLNPEFKNIVYIGRGGADMYKAITPLFEVLKTGLTTNAVGYKKLRLYFIGTSYAAPGEGLPTISALAKNYGVEGSVIEITDRISFYHTLITLKLADALFIPGSDDPKYTASKIYPYLLTHRPLLTIFNSQSGAVDVLNEFGTRYNYTYDTTKDLPGKIADFLSGVINGVIKLQDYNKAAEEKYSARHMTERQCALFDNVINGKA